jgi:hypothetical protein
VKVTSVAHQSSKREARTIHQQKIPRMYPFMKTGIPSITETSFSFLEKGGNFCSLAGA